MASDLEILPAIDLRGGRVVRLQQGDFARETAFSDDPVAVARDFAAAGARWLHVVDLDGARSGTPAHAQVIRSIVDAVGHRVAVEVAGGLRTSTAVAEAIAAGAARAVVGTAALRDPDFAGDLVRRHGADRIAVAIDVRDGLAVGEGWRSDAPGPAVASIVAALADVGITTFEVTAIERDGLLGGPDLGLLSGLIASSRGGVIASGGVASLDDIRAVAALGCAGAIVGRALYEGQLDLGAAIEAGRGTGTPDRG